MDETKKEFDKAKNYAKFTGWKKLTSEMNDLTTAAKLNKMLKMSWVNSSFFPQQGKPDKKIYSLS